MSHECPECGLTCYFGNDIDDCCFNRDGDVLSCTHCQCEDNDYCEEDED